MAISLGVFIQLLFLFLSFISAAVLLVTKFKKKFEDGIVIAPLALILVLYIFSLFGLLKIGLYICCLLLLICYVISIYSFITSNEKVKILKNFFTPTAIIFFVGTFIVLILCKNNLVLWWDELRLWGVQPKIMYYTNMLPYCSKDLLWFGAATYPPGIALLQYFGLKFSGIFNEPILYIVYYWFVMCLLVPIFSKIRRNKIITTTIGVFVILLLPYLFYNTASTSEGVAYFDLLIDILMGALFGYTLYSVYSYKGINKQSIFVFSLSLFVLTILKQLGVFFALVALGLFILDKLFLKNKFTFRGMKKKILYLLIPIFAILFGMLSWQLFTMSPSSEATNELSKSSIIDNLINHRPDYAAETLSHFVEFNLKTPYVAGFLSLAQFMVFFIVIIFLLSKAKKQANGGLLIYNIFLCLGLVAYLLVLLYCYLYVFTPGEAENLASVQRYSNSFLLGMGIALVYFINDYFQSETNDKNKFGKILIPIIILLFMSCSFIYSDYNLIDDFVRNNSNTILRAGYWEDHEISNQYVNDISENLKTNSYEKVGLLYDQGMVHPDNYSFVTLIHSETYFDLLDKKINIVPGFYGDGFLFYDSNASRRRERR